MPNVALIGYGAMARYVANQLKDSSWTLSDCICCASREDAARGAIGEGPSFVLGIDNMSALPDLVLDCAGHKGLRAHAAGFLAKGVPVISASLGALADPETHKILSNAAASGKTQYSLKGDALILVGDFSWCLVQCAGSALQGIRQPLNFPFKVLDLLFLHLEQLVKMFLMLYQFCCVAPYNTGPIPLLKQLAYSVEGSRVDVPSFVYQQELSTGRNASSFKLLSFQHAYPLDFSKRHVLFPFPVSVAH